MNASAQTLSSHCTASEHASVLSVQDISLGYASSGRQAATTVLADFSLELQPGEIIALLGPSGVGKSSLLRVLAGLQAAQAGDIRIKGRPLNGPNPALGLVFQDPSLLPWLTLEENVAFGLDFHHQPHLDIATRKQRVHQAIHEVGLQSARTRYPDELSGGMAQRTSLARTLARAPEILLLDEPFSALDEVTRHEMQSLLLQITSQHQAAAVLVTHDIDEALLLADRILLIGGQPGRLIGHWSVTQPHPRDETTSDLTTLRVDILQTLRTARLPRS
ncbi:ABC transporter ATP-binding protein [Castellaniella sp.]|uniref:ABC transporter ATP-binding protein n=1 Tax=Castellaniella sp. TaxID=1955812 RepID=UPI002AFE73A3|nr:ABC transporter ATP-binding protein [Castellaniella sp.]